jgi:thiol-disulfide isomerase/thioredoxin
MPRHCLIRSTVMLLTAACLAAPAHAWEVGRPIPRLNLIDGNGASVPFETWTGGWVVLRVGGSWCPPCAAERPSAEAFAAAQGIPVFSTTSAPPGSSVEAQFPREIEDAKRRGYRLDRTMRRDPSTPLDPPPPRLSVPITYVIAPDRRIVARWSGTAEYSDKKAHPFATPPTWRDWTEAILACAGAPLPAGLTEEAKRLRDRRIPPACR